MTHESHSTQPNASEAAVQAGLVQMERLQGYFDSLPKDDESRDELAQLLFEAVDGHIENHPVTAATGEREDRYSYVTVDKETGEQYRQGIGVAYARRFINFAESYRAEQAGKQQKPAGQEAVVLPFEKRSQPAHRKDKVEPKADTEGRATAQPKVEVESKSAVPTRTRRGAHRAQGAPKITPKSVKTAEPTHKKTNGKLELSDLVQVNKAGRAQISGSHYVKTPDKTARNGKFLSKHEMEQIMLHEEQIRKGLGERAVENGVGRIDALNRAHRDNGQMMSNKELAALLKGSGGAFVPEQIPLSSDDDQEEQKKSQDNGAIGGQQQATPHANSTDSSHDTQGNTVDPADINTDDIDNIANQPAQTARRSLKDRMLHRLSLAWTYVQSAGKEKGKRRGVAAFVVGAAAVGGAVLLAHHGSDVLAHASHGHSGGAGLPPTPDSLGLSSGASNLAEAVPAHLSLHQGDTIWGDIAQQAAQHGRHLSDAQIDQLTGQTLQANGLSWEDARHLPVGFRFDIPDEVREQLARAA